VNKSNFTHIKRAENVLRYDQNKVQSQDNMDI